VNSYAGATLIPGATGYNYHPTVLGYYFCLEDDAFCSSPLSNIIYISLLGIKEINSQFLTIYPNPTNSTMNLDWGTYKVNAEFNIYNTVGQSMRHEQLTNVSHYAADLSSLPDGNYYIVLKDAQGNYDTRNIEVKHN
jgi:hypothetical protein